MGTIESLFMPRTQNITRTQDISLAAANSTSPRGVSLPAVSPLQYVAKNGIVTGKIIQAVFKADANAGSQPFTRGLIHGTYHPRDNSADMHVSAADEGEHLKPGDAAVVLKALYDVMVQNHATTGTIGKIDWRPTGAAVQKLVVELLGEALGGTFSVMVARLKKAYRKNFGEKPTGARDKNVLSPDILPEYKAYLDAMQGENKVSIKPKIQGESADLVEKGVPSHIVASTINQDMMEDSDAGRTRLNTYKETLDTGVASGLVIEVTHLQIPAIIKVLQSI